MRTTLPAAEPAGSSHNRRGIVFVLSAPSGAGKTSLSQRLRADMTDVVQVTTCTTRSPRPGERDGHDYHFLSYAVFEQRVAAGDFLEWAQVHGHLYGTLRQSVDEATARGQDVLLVIDVQGAAQLRAVHVDAVQVFVVPPSWEALAERLQARGSEAPGVQAQRLLVARQELAHYTAYDYVVINDQLDQAVHTLKSIILAERQRIARLGLAPIASLLAAPLTKG
ncbi:MAG: guanylate kinase [Candidatus Tectimicrobiota bacterium]